MVPLQQRPLVADLPRHQPPRQRPREILLLRQPELIPPQEHVLRVQPRRDPIKPAAHREVADRHFRFAQRLHRLRRDLHVAHQVHLADLARSAPPAPAFLCPCTCSTAPALPHPHALRVQIQRPQFAARRHHRAAPRASPVCAATARTALSCSASRRSLRRRHASVSSGRQIPTSEQPGHFGESTSGGGISPDSAVAPRLQDQSAPSPRSAPRRTPPAPAVPSCGSTTMPSSHRYPFSRSTIPWTANCARSLGHSSSPSAPSRGRPCL